MIDMDLHWFSILFEGDYNDVMNNVADYVNYGNSFVNDGDSSGNHSSDNDDNDDASDEEGELFWKREFDRQKLVLCIAGALALYYNTYIYIYIYIIFLYTIALDASNREVLREISTFRRNY
jgi:hypothetical protein